MAKFLANENVPAEAVAAARRLGFDVAWVQEIAPGADDERVMALSLSQQRVLVTFDKGFGEMVFRHGRRATRGVILLRPRLRSPDQLAQFLSTILGQSIEWEGKFCVAREGLIKVVQLR